MTKFQWEQQLSKYLSELPKEERKKVLEYYDELFCDKYESGESEERIIISFGEPSRIALEILRSYDSGTIFADKAYDPNQDYRTTDFRSNQSNIKPLPIVPYPILTPRQNENYRVDTVSDGGYTEKPQDRSLPEQQQHNLGQSSFAPQIMVLDGNNQHQREVNPDKVAAVQKNSFEGNGAQTQPLVQNQPAVPISTAPVKKKKKWKHPLMIVLYVFLFFTVAIPLLSTLFGLLVGIVATFFALAACSVGGLVYAIIIPFMGLPLAQTLSQMGISLFVSGIGFLCIPIGVRIAKGIAKGFSKLKAWMVAKRDSSRARKQL